jgi:hypothetical protein
LVGLPVFGSITTGFGTSSPAAFFSNNSAFGLNGIPLISVTPCSPNLSTVDDKDSFEPQT